MGDNSVYNNLHSYAFSLLKSYVSNPLSSNKIRDFAKKYLISSQSQGEDIKTSLYHNTVSKYIVNDVNRELLSKNINELTNEENISFEKSKKNIRNIIENEIKKMEKQEKNKQEQQQEVGKAKEELNESKVDKIESKDGKQFYKFDNPNGNTPIVAEQVGNTTVADMIDKDASFVIDGSGNANVRSVKKAEEIVDDIKKERITNAYSMNNLNTLNDSGLNNDTKMETNILKSSNLELDGARYDSKTGLAFLQDGKVLDTEIKDNGDISISELGTSNEHQLTNEEKDKNMSKTDLLAYITELEEKGISREEAQAQLNNVPAYKILSNETKKNLLNSFHSENEDTKNMEQSNEYTKKLVSKPNIPSDKAGIASSIIISFVSGVISGVVIMLLVYFFLTH